MTRLILASASAGRRRVLRQAGIDPLVIVSGIDEDAVLASFGSDPSPGGAVCALAAAKADEVATHLPAHLAADCVVIGCDSMLELDGQLCGKPDSVDAARRQWAAMGGRAGTLYTGHAVLRLRDGHLSRREIEPASTTVHFARPEKAELEAYPATDEPLAVAGGFTLDGYGGWFVDRIEGDPSNVIGISLPLMRRLLKGVGVPAIELWSHPG
jgi:septum formation protein